MNNPTFLDVIRAFAKESNSIEGIRVTTKKHVEAHIDFMASDGGVDALIAFVQTVQPTCCHGMRKHPVALRDSPDVHGVRVAAHVAPASGPHIRSELERILQIDCPFEQHIAYETLHPFTDGNGRSGRVLWLRRYLRERQDDRHAAERGFLHSWYYHSLSKSRPAKSLNGKEF